MENDIPNTLKEIFQGRKNIPKLDTIAPKYQYNDWNYVGKINIKDCLMISFAYKYEQGKLIYGIFDYLAFFDNDFNSQIIVTPEKFQIKIINIIDSREEDLRYNVAI